jgi:two-component system, OmpR family, sensor histidine kinase VicK
LSAIQSSAELLREYASKMPEEKREDKLIQILVQVHHLNALIEDIRFSLQNSYIPPTVKIERVEIDPLIYATIRQTQQVYNLSSAIQYENKCGMSMLKLDSRLFERLIINLLSNAVKYSPKGGEIRVTLTQEGDDVVLRVADHGIGIPQSDLSHVFEPFFRAENTTTIPGTGFGLSIVRDCAALHGGAVSVESTLGEGATFSVRLPARIVGTSSKTPPSEARSATL